MLLVALWTVLALLAAGAVMLVASVAGGTSGGMAQFLADLRAGLSRQPDAEPESDDQADDEAVLLPASQVGDRDGDSGIDQIFTLGRPGPGYVAPEELSETLDRARQRAARGVAMITRR